MHGRLDLGFALVHGTEATLLAGGEKLPGRRRRDRLIIDLPDRTRDAAQLVPTRCRAETDPQREDWRAPGPADFALHRGIGAVLGSIRPV